MYTLAVMVFGSVVFEALFRPFSTANLRNKKTTSKFSAKKNLTRARKWGLIFNELQRWLEKKSYRAKIYAMTLGILQCKMQNSRFPNSPLRHGEHRQVRGHLFIGE